MQADPRSVIERLEATASLPPGKEERFNGYGVMGLPFKSGHVLAMRRFWASSVGSGYTSVWHRTSHGDWVFYANVDPRQSCTRYFGASASEAIETEIRLTWPAPFRLHLAMPALRFEWEITLQATAATRVVNAAGRLLPNAAWQSPAVLAAMGKVAGTLLGAGRVGLHGRVPNGQHFIANPRELWAVADSRARLAEEDFGPPGPCIRRPAWQTSGFPSGGYWRQVNRTSIRLIRHVTRQRRLVRCRDPDESGASRLRLTCV